MLTAIVANAMFNVGIIKICTAAIRNVNSENFQVHFSTLSVVVVVVFHA